MKSRFLEDFEVQALKEVFDVESFLPLYVSLETGLRIGDVVALKVSHVKNDGIHFIAKKTNKRGIAKISKRLRDKLPKKGVWLFPSPYKAGKHITRQAIWSRIKRAGKSAGLDLDGLSPHCMRKAFAVKLYKEKGFKATQEALQHSKACTTEIYAFADWCTGP